MALGSVCISSFLHLLEFAWSSARLFLKHLISFWKLFRAFYMCADTAKRDVTDGGVLVISTLSTYHHLVCMVLGTVILHLHSSLKMFWWTYIRIRYGQMLNTPKVCVCMYVCTLWRLLCYPHFGTVCLHETWLWLLQLPRSSIYMDAQ